MKKTVRKLALAKETLRSLEEGALRKGVGGAIATYGNSCIECTWVASYCAPCNPMD